MPTDSAAAKSGVQPIPKPKPQPKGRRERERPTLYTYGFLPGEAPTCWLAQFAPDVPCDGRMEKAHLIRAQVIRRELIRHHERAPLRKPERDALLWAPGVWRPACHLHHGMLDQAKTLRIPRSALPAETEAWAAEHGLEWWLDHEFGPVESA